MYAGVGNLIHLVRAQGLPKWVTLQKRKLEAESAFDVFNGLL